jgi:hypothetical protein
MKAFALLVNQLSPGVVVVAVILAASSQSCRHGHGLVADIFINNLMLARFGALPRPEPIS